MDEDRDDLLDTVESLVSAAIGVTTRTLATTPSAAELTLSQWRLLALVTQAATPMRLGALAVEAGMSAPSTSRMLARLVTRGLIRSIPDALDRRAVAIEPTDRGRAVVADVLARRRERIDRAVTRTAPRGTFARELARLAHALIEEEPDEDRARRAADGGDSTPPLRRHRASRRGTRRRAVGPRP